MKPFCLLSLLYLLISFSEAAAQTKSTDSANSFVESNNKKVLSSITEANKIIDTLEKMLSESAKTIERQNSIITGYGTTYTVISAIIGVLAVIGVLAPIYIYFTTIVPAKNIIKSFNRRVDNRLANYLKQKEIKELNFAIKNASNENDELAYRSAEKLRDYFYEHELRDFEFTDRQLFELFMVYKKRTNVRVQNMLLRAMLHKPSKFANDVIEEYITGRLIADNYHFRHAGIYFSKIKSIERFIPFLASYLSKDPLNNCHNFVELLKNTADWHFATILESETILSDIPENVCSLMIQNLSGISISKREILEESLLYKKGSNTG